MKKDKMKKKMMGYNAGGLQMVEKDGKKVPFYAADGKGKMMMGGKVMGYKHGGAHLTTSSTTARSGPTPNAEGLAREKKISNELDADMAAFKKRAAARKAKKAGKAKEPGKSNMAGGMIKKKMMGGGKVMGYKHGGKHGGKTSMPRGCGVATRQRPAKMVVMKGS